MDWDKYREDVVRCEEIGRLLEERILENQYFEFKKDVAESFSKTNINAVVMD